MPGASPRQRKASVTGPTQRKAGGHVPPPGSGQRHRPGRPWAWGGGRTKWPSPAKARRADTGGRVSPPDPGSAIPHPTTPGRDSTAADGLRLPDSRRSHPASHHPAGRNGRPADEPRCRLPHPGPDAARRGGRQPAPARRAGDGGQARRPEPDGPIPRTTAPPDGTAPRPTSGEAGPRAGAGCGPGSRERSRMRLRPGAGPGWEALGLCGFRPPRRSGS